MSNKNIYPYEELVERQRTVTRESIDLLGLLDDKQLNWKPSAEVWSAGQILDHLIVTNSGYFDQLEQIASGKKAGNIWQKIPVLPVFAGRLIKNAVDPNSVRKIKAPGVFQPTMSEINPDVLDRFEQTQSRLLELMDQTKSLPLDQIIISSPAASFLCFSLLDAYTILALHNRRHLDQARRLLQNKAFPKASQGPAAVAATAN